jgi:ABC-2 type transport system permease protein
MIGAAALLFSAVLIAGATASFWSPQSHEAANIFTFGGQFMTSYPMHIYQRWLVSLFTFIIPLAFINYYPSLYLLDKRDPLGLPAWISFLSPVVALAAFGGALAVWRVGVRRYQSTGS